MISSWSHWLNSGKPTGWPHLYQLVLASNRDGRLELFSVSTDGQLWHIWQTVPNGGWSQWASRGAPDDNGITLTHQLFGRSVVASNNQDGRLVCIALITCGLSCNNMKNSVKFLVSAYGGYPYVGVNPNPLEKSR